MGNENIIKETIQGIVKWGLNVKIEDDLSDYLSCKIVFNKNTTKAWLGQPHMVRKIADKLETWYKTYRPTGLLVLQIKVLLEHQKGVLWKR